MDKLNFNSIDEMKKWFGTNYSEYCNYQLVADIIDYALYGKLSIDNIYNLLFSLLQDIAKESEIDLMAKCVYNFTTR